MNGSEPSQGRSTLAQAAQALLAAEAAFTDAGRMLQEAQRRRRGEEAYCGEGRGRRARALGWDVMSKVEDLITIAEAMARIHRGRGFVKKFAQQTGTLHMTGERERRVVWPEFERFYLAQRDVTTPKGRAFKPLRSGPYHHLVRC